MTKKLSWKRALICVTVVVLAALMLFTASLPLVEQTVDQIELKDDSILTAKGVGIGSTRDDVLKAYGQGYDKSQSSDTALIWRQGNRQLEFYFENGIASAVNFVNK